MNDKNGQNKAIKTILNVYTDYSLWKACRNFKRPKNHLPPLRLGNGDSGHSDAKKGAPAVHLQNIFTSNSVKNKIQIPKCSPSFAKTKGLVKKARKLLLANMFNILKSYIKRRFRIEMQKPHIQKLFYHSRCPPRSCTRTITVPDIRFPYSSWR